jgi:hypothetical protein
MPKVVDACRHGDSDLVITTLRELAIIANALMLESMEHAFLLYAPGLDCYSVNCGRYGTYEESKEVLEMDVAEPRLRRRGFFLHSDTTGDRDTTEYDNPEGVTVRIRISRPSMGHRGTAGGGRSRTGSRSTDDGRPQIRSGSVTGSRQRAHLPR